MRAVSTFIVATLVSCSDQSASKKSEPKEKPVNLNPDFPIIEGHYQMSKEWSVVLPSKFNRRVEDGSLVIWKPGFTMWTIIWNNDNSESPEERLKWIKEDSAPDAFDVVTESTNGALRYAYRLKEDSEDDRQPAFYCYAIGRDGHVQMAIYFDSPHDLSDAQAIWRSLTESPHEDKKSE